MRDYGKLIALFRAFGAECSDPDCCRDCQFSGFCDHGFTPDEIADAIEELTNQERPAAFWVDTQPHVDDSDYKKDGMSYFCSNCKHRAGKYKHRTYKFCPWCGAKIIQKGETDDKQDFIYGQGRL